jgi:SNF2 family DNA or RNA helicase
MIHQPSLAGFTEYPAILELFEALVHSGCAGRTYRTQEEASSQGRLAQQGVQEEEAKRSKARAVVRRRRRRPRKARTLNVFDLLLAYLQPPLETRLAEPVLFPPGRRPYDYQIEGIEFLAEHSAALLGDEMGLGKTIQTIVALQLLFRREGIRSVLVLCKRSLLGTWEKELNKWAPELYVTKVRGTQEEREQLWSDQAQVYVTTYDTLRQDVNRGLAIAGQFDVAVLDEVQEIKNPTTGKSRAVRAIEAKYRWGLSGTPLENKLEDVVAIFDYLEPALFKSNGVDRSLTYDPSQWLTPANVKQRIDSHFLRRRLKDVKSDLPEKVSREIWLDLTDAQRVSYDFTTLHTSRPKV